MCNMDLMEDEPRKHPKPVPFCQNALLHPTVPEVSLLVQENFDSQPEKKNDSFSGTEFQTYNSWRWNHMNQNNTALSSPDFTKVTKPTSNKNNFLIKDKYFTSDLEKRKNEILYGEADEPRRPLPPRANPIVPTSIDSFFSNISFDDSQSLNAIQKTLQESQNQINYEDKNLTIKYTNEACCKKELDNSEKLYSIISDQNKQMQVLHKQIEQLLKLQEVKDKHTEQLLKSQESKEKKIEQLLKALDIKSKEVEELVNCKEKQEQHFQELLKSHENMKRENINLKKKLKEITRKDVQTVGVMASVQIADASIGTDFDDIVECSAKKIETSEGNISVLRESSKFDERDKSLSLHSSDLPVILENAPTPQSSIHVDIQDFPDSSDESEAGIPSNSFSGSKETQTNPLGYTFYNNVLTQLKDIIQNSTDKENKNNVNKPENQVKDTRQSPTDCNYISGSREPESLLQASKGFEKKNGGLDLNNSRTHERFSDKFQKFCLKDTSSPSDISLRINALALKYLKQEQISELDLQTPIPSCQHDVTIYNVTNLSFGSMRYLDRYQILPKVKENQIHRDNIQKGEHSPAEFLRRRKRMTIEENITSIGNILDISTLNQQPKLL